MPDTNTDLLSNVSPARSRLLIAGKSIYMYRRGMACQEWKAKSLSHAQGPLSSGAEAMANAPSKTRISPWMGRLEPVTPEVGGDTMAQGFDLHITAHGTRGLSHTRSGHELGSA